LQGCCTRRCRQEFADTRLLYEFHPRPSHILRGARYVHRHSFGQPLLRCIFRHDAVISWQRLIQRILPCWRTQLWRCCWHTVDVSTHMRSKVQRVAHELYTYFQPGFDGNWRCKPSGSSGTRLPPPFSVRWFGFTSRAMETWRAIDRPQARGMWSAGSSWTT
jgi:hypothetical protein